VQIHHQEHAYIAGIENEKGANRVIHLRSPSLATHGKVGLLGFGPKLDNLGEIARKKQKTKP